MDHRIRREKKAYAMRRMAAAIARAVEAGSALEQARAARWAAAWGALGGIRSPGIRLRRNVLRDPGRARR
jgi:hypothetical protein